MSLIINEDHISISTNNGNPLFRYLDEGSLISGEKYTLSAKIDYNIYTFTFDPVDSFENEFLFYSKELLTNKKIGRVGILKSVYPCNLYWMKLEKGINFTGLPQWNLTEERIKCGLDSSNTGWLPLPLSEGIINGDDNPMYAPMYRRVGQTVYVHGLIKGVTSTGSSSVLATLPVGFRPNGYRPKFVTWGERQSISDASTLAAFRIYDTGVITMMNCYTTPTADLVYTLNFNFII